METAQFDVLREIGNIGAGNATTALSKLLDARIDMRVPKVNLLGFSDITSIIGNEEDVMVGILLGLEGDVNGMMMFLLDMTSAEKLVEAVLKKHKKVADAVVVGLPDKEWGHRIHAIVETSEAVTAKELIKFALDYLPPYKIPKSFEFVDSIPRNESGKVVRSRLIEESLEKGY